MFSTHFQYGESLPKTVTIPNPGRTSRSFMFHLDDDFDVDVVATFNWSHDGTNMVPLTDSTGTAVTVTIPSATGQAGIMLTDLLAAFVHITFTHESGTAKPVISGEAESDITDTSATVSATVTPGGSATSVSIEYGTTTAYGDSVDATESPLTAGTSGASVSFALAELTPSTTYHYRIVAANALGTTNGTDQTFETLAE